MSYLFIYKKGIFIVTATSFDVEGQEHCIIHVSNEKVFWVYNVSIDPTIKPKRNFWSSKFFPSVSIPNPHIIKMEPSHLASFLVMKWLE